MSIYLVEAELKVRHLYSVQATNEEEAKEYIEAVERNKGDFDGRNMILDKVWIGNIDNSVVDIQVVWGD